MSAVIIYSRGQRGNIAEKSIDDIAREVLAGKWGSGDARRRKLAVLICKVK